MLKEHRFIDIVVGNDEWSLGVHVFVVDRQEACQELFTILFCTRLWSYLPHRTGTGTPSHHIQYFTGLTDRLLSLGGLITKGLDSR